MNLLDVCRMSDEEICSYLEILRRMTYPDLRSDLSIEKEEKEG